MGNSSTSAKPVPPPASSSSEEPEPELTTYTSRPWGARPLAYEAGGGSSVVIEPELNPYEVLGITPTATVAETKDAFKRGIKTVSREVRARVSLAYDMITASEFYARVAETRFAPKRAPVVPYEFCFRSAATKVELAGSFTRPPWKLQVAMRKQPDGRHTLTVHLPPGRHEFKFIVDGAWRCEPSLPMTGVDPHRNNVVLAAAGADSSLLSVNVYVVVGDLAKLKLWVTRNPFLLNEKDSRNRTLLYRAARSGYYDMCAYLLDLGASPNEVQADKSTPLHAACFYDQELVLGLLLEYGCVTTLRNDFGDTCADEAGPDCRALLDAFAHDAVASLAGTLTAAGLARGVRKIEFGGRVVAKEVYRAPEQLDAASRRIFEGIGERWETAWHGTRFRYVESIMRTGLAAAGTRLGNGDVLQPPKGHYKLGETHFNIRDWARAIFVSPSLLYAGHPCYAERVFSEGERWCVVIKVAVKPGSYGTFDPTVFRDDPIDGEPSQPESRVPVVEDDKEVIQRIESSRNVIVKSILFVHVKFIEEPKEYVETFEEIKRIFE